MYALVYASMCHIRCGNYAAANAQQDELVALAEEKAPSSGRRLECLLQSRLFGLTGKAPDAVQMIASGITALRSTGSTIRMPLYLSYLAKQARS
jgi:hypothetical protein